MRRTLSVVASKAIALRFASAATFVRLLAALMLLSAWMLCPSVLFADTTSLSGATEITSLPCTLSAPGVYFLSQNFVLNINNANAITVTASGVTIDFNGHTITDVAAGSGVVASGIFGPSATNLTVRNGTIRGFTYGVYLNNPADSGVLIENVRFLDQTYAGVGLYPSGSLVRRCQMYRIGGSTQPQWPNGVGLLVFGSNDRVLDCDVSELSTASYYYYPTVGIYVDLGGNTLVVNNRIGGAQCGVYFQAGVSGKYRDNLCAPSVNSPYTGGTDVGNN